MLFRLSLKHKKYLSGVVLLCGAPEPLSVAARKNEETRPSGGSFPLSVRRYFTTGARSRARGSREGEEGRRRAGFSLSVSLSLLCWVQHGRSARPYRATPPPTCGRLRVRKEAVRCSTTQCGAQVAAALFLLLFIIASLDYFPALQDESSRFQSQIDKSLYVINQFRFMVSTVRGPEVHNTTHWLRKWRYIYIKLLQF